MADEDKADTGFVLTFDETAKLWESCRFVTCDTRELMVKRSNITYLRRISEKHGHIFGILTSKLLGCILVLGPNDNPN